MRYLSSKEVQDLFGVHRRTIYNWRKRGILPYRRVNERVYQYEEEAALVLAGQQHHPPSILSDDEFKSTVDGHLLGDGFLVRQGAAFGLKTKNHQYALRLQQYLNASLDKLYGLKQENVGTIEINGVKTTPSPAHVVRAYSTSVFSPFYERWYRNGKKVVPGDLDLTPLMCNRWFCDDGTTSNTVKGKCRIVLCTDCFEVEEVEWLCQKLLSAGIEARRIMYLKTRPRIEISRGNIFAFLSWIGQSPVSSYEYKWDVGDYRDLSFACPHCSEWVECYGAKQRHTCGKQACINQYVACTRSKK